MISINRWTDGSVIHSGDFASVKECLEDGVRKGICFDYADLNGAQLNNVELNYAELNYVKLNNAWLNYAKLSNAKLNYAKLNDAKLYRAELSNAKLNNAWLNGARLNYVELNYTELNCARLNYVELNRARLNGAELNDAKLNFADLWNTIGNGKQIKNINNLRWPITYTKDTLQIGCKRHLISEWASFTDERIECMDEEALEFWKEHKQHILDTVKYSTCDI